MLGYLVVSFGPGFVLALLPMPVPAAVLVIVILVAGGWELTAAKRLAMRRCCRTWPVRYRGRSGRVTAIKYGLRHSGYCLLVSGPAMVALMLAGHPGWATVVLAVVMSARKLLTEPHRWRTLVALGWLATGLAVAGATAFD